MGEGGGARGRVGRSGGGGNRVRVPGWGGEGIAGVEAREAAMKNQLPNLTNKFGLATAMIAIGSTMLTLIIAPAFAHDMAAMGNMDGHDKSAAPNAMGSHMAMDAHMVMTPVRPETLADIERARGILNTLRRMLSDYRDSQVALDQGYKIFLPTVPQDVYHFTDYSAAAEEYAGHFNPSRPASLLYVKNSRGDYVLVGAMYSAPPDSTPGRLHHLIPLSLGAWRAPTH